ncbi:MAG: transpeptidase family protein [Chlorobiaceae bacterium]|jgi:cell division protein FtsI (penicillin-binding protein 3)|nr:transpeptidase family protein [Chlorobiaceae bacterium]
MTDQPDIKRSDEHEFGKRLGFIVLIYFVFVVALVGKLLSIQVINVKKYKEKASRQYERVVTEAADRGVILDRHARMLGESIETITFYADPGQVRNTLRFDAKGSPSVDKKSGRQIAFDNSSYVATLFSRHFGGGSAVYLKELRQKKDVVVLARRVSAAKALPLMQEKIPGVWHEKELQRYYLNVASQVIGLTNSTNAGSSGLELQLDSDLRGRDGTRIYQRSATGRKYPAPDARQFEAIRGNTVQLTLDADMQSIVEDELSKAVPRFDADAASSIVMDVRSGEILAMANYPTFNLNDRTTWSPDKSRNRAVTDSYEPGSTFKLVMAAAATEILKRKANDVVFANNGALPLYNLVIRDHEPYGNLTFREAIMYSSNIVAAKTAMEVGSSRFYTYVKNFGFGQRTGVGMIGESPGRVRPLANWDKTTLPWMGYGYQVMATPMQTLQAYAAVANDGEMMKPFIIKKVIGPDGSVLRENVPQKIRRVVSTETARYLGKEYFKAVVDSGTAKNASVPGLTVAGKTGTARRAAGGSYANAVYVSSFVGYFPVESPRYAIIVIVENPKTAYYAATVAAPVFSSITSRMMACSEEMQKNLALRSSEQELLDAVRTVSVPDLRGLSGREVQRMLKWLDLGMEFTGSIDGNVVSQSVAPGQKIEKKSIVKVALAMNNNNNKSLL